MIANRFVVIDGVKPRIGGQSTIKKAFDPVTSSFVAVKFVAIGNTRILNRVFNAEVRSLEGLSHPNVIRLITSGVDDTETPFVVLEWVERSLLDYFKEQQTGDWATFLDEIFTPLLSATAHLHLRDREHRDIKPGNILLDDVGRVVLADFGIGKAHDRPADPTETIANLGSGVYAPPEHVTTIPYVRDVYSLAVVAIQAMTPNNIENFHELAPALAQIDVPSGYRDVLAECIDVDPARRPSNAALLEARFASLRQQSESQETRQANRIHLDIARQAAEQIVAGGYVERAERFFLEDLKGEIHLSFWRDRESLQWDKKTLLLVGSERRYTLRVEDGSPSLKVIAAGRRPLEELENLRHQSMRVDQLATWSTRASSVPAVNQRGRDNILLALNQFLTDRESGAEKEIEGETAALVSVWRKSLQVREEVARRHLGTLKYKSVRTKSRESTFTLTEASELDLVGTEWDAPREASNGWGLRGMVLVQDAARVVIRWQRSLEGVSFPKSGALQPSLGPTKNAIARQSDAISTVGSHRSADGRLADYLANPSSVQPPILNGDIELVDDLDEDKSRALRAAMELDSLMVVKGPPGTGKTKLITALVRAYLRRDPDARVLLVSQSHAAVDNALHRLDSAGLANMVRLGRPNDPRVADQTRHLLLEPQMEKWAGEVRASAEQYLRSRAESLGLDARHLLAALALKEVIEALGERSQIEREMRAASDLPALEDPLTVDGGELADPADFFSRLERTQISYESSVSALRGHLGTDFTIPADIGIEDAEDLLSALIVEPEMQAEVTKHVGLQAEWLQRLSSDETMSSVYLRNASVVAGTCLGFLSVSAARDMTFDLCILDEASKATATEALVPLSRSRRTVLLGDLNQLPPLDEEAISMPEVLAEYGVSRNDFEETIFGRLSASLPDGAQFALTKQFRMVRPIGDLVSRVFYDGSLVTVNSRELAGYSSLGAPVLWLSTESMKDRRESKTQSGSFVNLAEARSVVTRLLEIEAALATGKMKHPGKVSVLVAAPYRGQVEELRRRVAGIAARHIEIEVDSVDAVQGRESDLVVLSLVRSNLTYSTGFLSRDHWRRVNVALSRARFGLTIVGDAPFFSISSSALSDVLDYMNMRPSDCEIRVLDA